MNWHPYVSYFFGGIFIANGVPHYVMGLTGRAFPTPFATPPGKGESSALINTAWGLANFVAGLLLLIPGHFTLGINWSVASMMLGVTGMSLMLTLHFSAVYSRR